MNEFPWAAVVSAGVNFAVLAYMFGGLNQRIKKLEEDFTGMTDSNRRVDDRVHDMAVSVGKIEVMLASAITTIQDKATCPMQRKKPRADEGD